ncbi:MAG TPA: response regulator [Thermoanaerobaculia bacterium]|nr:response regulator [Thermoanaerobaculia bacterium]
MRRKSVLVVEDRPTLRNLLKVGLERRGFLVASAADEEKAREESKALCGDLDVVILDVELQGGGNGLDFGMWLKEEWQKQSRWLPEFLVYSAHEKPDYFQTAIHLGAAAYLQKAELGGDPDDPTPVRKKPRIDRIAHHVKALALRRALRTDRPNGARHILEIARRSHSLNDSLERFCRDLLVEELEITLGGHFILLLAGERRGIVRFPGSEVETDASSLFDRIQATVHSRLGEVDPLVIDAGDDSCTRSLCSEEDVSARRILDRLHGTAFIPLGSAKGGALTLGLVPDSRAPEESPVEFARTLGQYLTPVIVTHRVELTSLWTMIDMERRTQLKATSDFCLYQGQELEALLQEAEEEGKDGEGRTPLGKLHAVAQELRGAGELLAQVELLAERTGGDIGGERIEMDKLLQHLWSTGLSGHLRLPDGTLQVERRCSAEAPKSQVEKAASQILFWLGRRLTRLSRKEDAPRTILCRLDQDQEGGRAIVQFEEHTSRRMPKRMREILFDPFNALPFPEPGEVTVDETLKGHRLGLYLARILAETAGGSLDEDSDAIPGNLGHRFILQLPAAH